METDKRKPGRDDKRQKITQKYIYSGKNYIDRGSARPKE